MSLLFVLDVVLFEAFELDTELLEVIKVEEYEVLGLVPVEKRVLSRLYLDVTVLEEL